MPEDFEKLTEMLQHAFAERAHPPRYSSLLGSVTERVDQIDDPAALKSLLHQALSELAARVPEAYSDTLTGLSNRRSYDSLSAKTRDEAEEQKSPHTILVVDIDKFKKFNDTYGHETGDKVLATVAGVISNTVRNTDIAFRYGGEEMVVILPFTSLSHGTQMAERIREAVQNTPLNDTAGTPLPAVTVSIGVARFQPGDNRETIFKRADEALYIAKETGRNRVVSNPDYASNALPALKLS